MFWFRNFFSIVNCCFVAVFLSANSNSIGAPLSFTIVSPVIISEAVLASAIFNGPPMEIAVREINEIYRKNFNFSLKLLISPRTQDCTNMLENVQDIFSEFMYRDLMHERIAAVIAPGCMEGYEVAQIGRDFDFLVILTVATDFRVMDKNVFGNVIMSSNLILNYFLSSTVGLLKTYNWTTVYIVYDSAGSAYAGSIGTSQALLQILTNSNGFLTYSYGVDPTTDVNYASLLDDIKNQARVVFFTGHALSLRRFMIAASVANMTNGDYIYISASPFEYPQPDFGNFTWQNYDRNDMVAKEAYQSLLLIRPVSTDFNAKRNEFFSKVIELSKSEYNYTYGHRLNITEMVCKLIKNTLIDDLSNTLVYSSIQPSPFTIASYASVYMLAQVMNETLSSSDPDLDSNLDLDLFGRNFVSAKLASKFWNRCFETPLGEFCFDAFGQRQIDLEIVQINFTTGLMDRQIFVQNKFTQAIKATTPVKWLPHFPWPVPNTPLCGLSGTTGPCQDNTAHYVMTSAVSSSVAVLIIFVVTALAIWQKIVSDATLRSQRWKIDYNLLQKINDADRSTFDIGPTGRLSTLTSHLVQREVSQFSTAPVNLAETATLTGKVLFQGRPVWIKSFQTKNNSDSKSKKYFRCLNYLYDLHHQNLATFLGLVTQPEPGKTLLVNEWCPRGNIHEIIDPVTNRVHIDWHIKTSLVADLVEALKFIHHSFFKNHGNLTPTVCLIDAQLTLKISELGYSEILAFGSGVNSIGNFLKKTEKIENNFYSAPESFVDDRLKKTSEADVYSVGRIMQGIATDFDAVRMRNSLENSGVDCPAVLHEKIISCLKINPKERPSASHLVSHLSTNNSKLLDKILQRMATYTEELEEAVFVRTLELEEEQRKCDALLLEMIPADIIYKLRYGEPVLPEFFEMVSMSFTDLVDFVDFVSCSPVLDVIAFLNMSHGLFDQVITGHDVYKVETIADSYFLSSGLPVRNEQRHAREICACAVELRAAFAIKCNSTKLQVRIGIHSGSCVATVVGLKVPRYCLFGDTVNTASRMKSHGEPSRIHISEDTAVMLDEYNSRFEVKARGVLDIKGKGQMKTFWLETRREHAGIRSSSDQTEILASVTDRHQ